MDTRQAMKIVVGADLDPSFKPAFHSADRQFKELGKDITDLKKKQKLISKFEMNTVAVEKARVKLNSAQKAVMELRREASKNPTAKLNQQLETARNKAERLARALEKERTQLTEVSSSMRSAGLSTRSYRLENEKLTHTLDKLQQRQQRLARISSQQRNLKAGFSEMKGRAMGMAAAGAASGFALKPGLDFQTAASELQAKSSGMTDEQRAMLEAQAKELQLKMKFTGAEVLQGQTFLSMAGFNPDEIKAASKGMLDLAAASGMGLSESADISSNILSGFGLKAKEMGRVSDVLTKTFTSSNVTLGMLGETMKYVAPDARNAGMSIEEVATMVGLLGNVGLQGSMAGTALRSSIKRLAAPPKEARKALDSLGLSVKDAEGNFKNMPQFLQEFSGKLKNVKGDVNKTALVTKVFGTEASSAMLELLTQADATTGGFDTLFKEIKNSLGKSEKVASTMTNNVQGGFTRLGSSLSAMGQAAFEPFQDDIQKMIDSVANVVGKTAEWMGQNPELVKSIGMIGGGLFALGTASLVAKAAVMGLKLVGLSGFKTLLRFTPVVGGLTRGLGLLAKATPFVVTGIRAIGLALMANPIGAVIGGIALAATAIISNWDTLQPWFSSMWEGVKGIFDTAWNGLKQGFLTYTPLGQIISNWEPIKGFMSSLWSSVKQQASSAWDVIKTAFMNFHPLGLIIKNWEPVKAWFTSLPEKFRGYGSMIMEGLKNGLVSGVKAVTGAVSGVADKITGKFRSLLGIKSPARVPMRDAGFVMEGYEVGMKKNTYRPISAIKKMGAGLLSENESLFARLAKPALITGALSTGALPQMVAAENIPSARQLSMPAIQGSSPVITIHHNDKFEMHFHDVSVDDKEELVSLFRDEYDRIQEDREFRTRAGYYDKGSY